MLSFVKGRALTLPLWLTNQLHKSLRCSFPSAVFAGINLWSKLGLSNGNPCRCRGAQGPPGSPAPGKKPGVASHRLPPKLPYPPTLAFLPTPLIDRGLKTNPGRKAGLPAGAAGQTRTRCRAAGRHLPGNLRSAGSRAGRARHRNILQ